MKIELPRDYVPGSDEDYMNDRQREYFRRKLTAWRDELLEEYGDTRRDMEAGESAGADLKIDGEGNCEALPGYRVVPVPCSGWVHMLTVERALRRGASGRY